jgi:hypothetical protein
MMNKPSTSPLFVLPVSSRLRGENERPSVDAPHPEPSPG